MKDVRAFAAVVWKDAYAIVLSILLPTLTFLTWLRDEFFPNYTERLKIPKLLPGWRWQTWLIISLFALLYLCLRAGAEIWSEKESLATATDEAPKVILDFCSLSLTYAWRDFVLRNIEKVAAFNITVEEISVRQWRAGFSSISRLLAEDTAYLQTVITRDGERQKELSGLAELLGVLSRERFGENDGVLDLPLCITFEDVRKRRFRSDFVIHFNAKDRYNPVHVEFVRLAAIR
jgi:hypothetical protein